MIVTCPSCSTRFYLDPALLGFGGRRVRCRKCSHVWLQESEDDEPTPKREAFSAVLERVEIEPIPESVRPDLGGDTAAAPRKAGFDAGAMLLRLLERLTRITLKDVAAAAMGFAGALLVGAVIAAAFWPAAVNDKPSLVFEDVKMGYAGNEKEPQFDISGMVVNTGYGTHSVPLIDVAILSPKGVVDGAIQLHAGEETVTSEKAVPFSGTFRGWPEEGSSVRLQFAVEP